MFPHERAPYSIRSRRNRCRGSGRDGLLQPARAARLELFHARTPPTRASTRWSVPCCATLEPAGWPRPSAQGAGREQSDKVRRAVQSLVATRLMDLSASPAAAPAFVRLRRACSGDWPRGLARRTDAQSREMKDEIDASSRARITSHAHPAAAVPRGTDLIEPRHSRLPAPALVRSGRHNHFEIGPLHTHSDSVPGNGGPAQ